MGKGNRKERTRFAHKHARNGLSGGGDGEGRLRNKYVRALKKTEASVSCYGRRNLCKTKLPGPRTVDQMEYVSGNLSRKKANMQKKDALGGPSHYIRTKKLSAGKGPNEGDPQPCCSKDGSGRLGHIGVKKKGNSVGGRTNYQNAGKVKQRVLTPSDCILLSLAEGRENR